MTLFRDTLNRFKFNDTNNRQTYNLSKWQCQSPRNANIFSVKTRGPYLMYAMVT